MKKFKTWLDSPITWRQCFKFGLIGTVISVIVCFIEVITLFPKTFSGYLGNIKKFFQASK